MTVRNLIDVMQDWEFVEISGKLCGESPSLSGRVKDIPEDIYKQVVDKEILDVGLLEDSDDCIGYGIRILYDDLDFYKNLF